MTITKAQKKAEQIQKTIDKLNNQLEELRQLNKKNLAIEKLSSDAWCNDSTISRLISRADGLQEINLIK